MSENPFVVDQEEWRTAGLRPKGSFKFKVLAMEPAERERKDGRKYNVIAGRLEATEQVTYDGEGNFKGIEELENTHTRFQDFGVAGGSLQLIKSLYKTMTGRYPEGVFNPETGRYEIDVLETAKELVGHSAWNVVYWTKPSEKAEDLGAQYDRITYTFTSNPRQKMKVAKAKEEKEDE